jgi:hypothetical protein
MTSWDIDIWEISLFKRIAESYHENYEEINGFYWVAFWLFIIIYFSLLVLAVKNYYNIIREYINRKDSLYYIYIYGIKNTYIEITLLIIIILISIVYNYFLIKRFLIIINNILTWMINKNINDIVGIYLLVPNYVFILIALVTSTALIVNIFNKKSKSGEYSNWLIAFALVSISIYLICIIPMLLGYQTNLLLLLGMHLFDGLIFTWGKFINILDDFYELSKSSSKDMIDFFRRNISSLINSVKENTNNIDIKKDTPNIDIKKDTPKVIKGKFWARGGKWIYILKLLYQISERPTMHYKRTITVSPKGIVILGGLPGMTIDNTKPPVLIAPKPEGYIAPVFEPEVIAPKPKPKRVIIPRIPKPRPPFVPPIPQPVFTNPYRALPSMQPDIPIEAIHCLTEDEILRMDTDLITIENNWGNTWDVQVYNVLRNRCLDYKKWTHEFSIRFSALAEINQEVHIHRIGFGGTRHDFKSFYYDEAHRCFKNIVFNEIFTSKKMINNFDKLWGQSSVLGIIIEKNLNYNLLTTCINNIGLERCGDISVDFDKVYNGYRILGSDIRNMLTDREGGAHGGINPYAFTQLKDKLELIINDGLYIINKQKETWMEICNVHMFLNDQIPEEIMYYKLVRPEVWGPIRNERLDEVMTIQAHIGDNQVNIQYPHNLEVNVNQPTETYNQFTENEGVIQSTQMEAGENEGVIQSTQMEAGENELNIPYPNIGEIFPFTDNAEIYPFQDNGETLPFTDNGDGEIYPLQNNGETFPFTDNGETFPFPDYWSDFGGGYPTVTSDGVVVNPGVNPISEYGRQYPYQEINPNVVDPVYSMNDVQNPPLTYQEINPNVVDPAYSTNEGNSQFWTNVWNKGYEENIAYNPLSVNTGFNPPSVNTGFNPPSVNTGFNPPLLEQWENNYIENTPIVGYTEYEAPPQNGAVFQGYPVNRGFNGVEMDNRGSIFKDHRGTISNAFEGIRTNSYDLEENTRGIKRRASFDEPKNLILKRSKR